MRDEPIVKAKSINPKVNSSQNNANRNNREQRESFKMGNMSNNSKVTKIQDKNINGNYGRIYIQDSQNNRGGYIPNDSRTNNIYSKKYTQDNSNNSGLRSNRNQSQQNYNYNNNNNKNTYAYSRTNNYNYNYNQNQNQNNNRYNNNNNRYANSVDRNNMNKYRDQRGNDNKSSHLRRKSFDRGGDYNNIMITHIIYSSREDIDFHIIDPLMITTEESRRKYKGSLDKNNRNGKNGNVKVDFRSSCDNIKIIPKTKKRNIGKTEIVPHRIQPPQSNNYRINNYNNSYSKMQREKNNRRY